MAVSNRQPTRRLDHWIHGILLTGTTASALLLIAGLGLKVAGFGSHTTGPNPRTWEILRGLHRLDPSTLLLGVGLLMLAATPPIRVVALAVGWSIMGRWRFALVALTVLGLLSLSLLLGFR